MPAGVVGEITCRPKSDHVMSIGYIDAAAIDSGLRVEPHEEWFATGDLGSLDERRQSDVCRPSKGLATAPR